MKAAGFPVSRDCIMDTGDDGAGRRHRRQRLGRSAAALAGERFSAMRCARQRAAYLDETLWSPGRS
jgi:hypothetical protein